MRKLHGWHEIDVPDAFEGASYRYVVETRESGVLAVPDPASRSNPQGVHGASRIVDPRGYAWRSSEWRGDRGRMPWSMSCISAPSRRKVLLPRPASGSRT